MPGEEVRSGFLSFSKVYGLPTSILYQLEQKESKLIFLGYPHGAGQAKCITALNTLSQLIFTIKLKMALLSPSTVGEEGETQKGEILPRPGINHLVVRP